MAPSSTNPPPPYRSSPWYDPRAVHQPCQCPRCRKPRRRHMPKLKVALAGLGGIALPLGSLLANSEMHVVALGLVGHVAILLSITGVLLHLLFPPDLQPDENSSWRLQLARSLTLRTLLLLSSVVGCLIWGYLALLFLPMLPASLVGVVFIVGLCGLCPYAALALAVVQTVREYRFSSEGIGRRATRALLLCGLLAPPLLAAGLALAQADQREATRATLQQIGSLEQDSTARLQQIATLEGQETHLVELFLATRDAAERRCIARVYHRLMDTTVNAAVERARNDGRDRAWIRPWGFIQGRPLLDLKYGRIL
jgi:hypothetical protein